jgi:hypothetical protein
MLQKSRLLIVTAVWGDWHVSKFLEVNLPTLLAAGNFPALAAQCDVSYVIFTSNADAARVRNSAQVGALSRLMRVEFRTISAHSMRSPIEAHHEYWGKAIERAKKDASFVLLMPPDVAWSDGSFSHVGRLLAQGKRAIFMTYLRAESESFSQAIQKRQRVGETAISVSGAELVELCLRALHPLMAAYVRESRTFPMHPEMMLWPVEGEGVLCRMLAREMFVYSPEDVRLNEYRLADSRIALGDMEIVRDSDNLFAVSLAPFEKESNWYADRGMVDVEAVGDWWLDYDSWINDYVAGAKLRWHFRPVTESQWRARELGADVFLRRAAASREGRRTWRAARTAACTGASRLVAVATQAGLMPHVMRGRGGAHVFLPSNGALAALGKDNFDHLQSAVGERDLTRLMRAHFVPSREPVNVVPIEQRLGASTRLELEAADGARLSVERTGAQLRVNGIPIVGNPLASGKNRIYVIEGVLGHVPGSTRRMAETSVAI